VATSHVEAMENKGILDFGMQSVDAHTQIAASGVTSVAAQSFIAQLPKAHAALDLFRRISPKALRQRRFRGRQAALRNGSEALQSASRTAQGDDENTDDGDDQKAPT
jgi:hypothetical protein